MPLMTVLNLDSIAIEMDSSSVIRHDREQMEEGHPKLSEEIQQGLARVHISFGRIKDIQGAERSLIKLL